MVAVGPRWSTLAVCTATSGEIGVITGFLGGNPIAGVVFEQLVQQILTICIEIGDEFAGRFAFPFGK